jgi:hypothetical protein
MLTLETVFQSEIGHTVIQELSSFTEHPIKLLCLYLLYEKSKGTESQWYSYINTLPSTFTTTVCWRKEDISLLEDKWLINKTYDRLTLIETLYSDIIPVIKVTFMLISQANCKKKHDELFPKEFFGIKDFKWAWCCFMTRSVFYDSNYVLDMYKLSSLCSKFRKRNNYAMVPLLDGLNHTNVEVSNL